MEGVFMFKLLKNKKGFTVPEILTVVTVMAILTVVAVPLFGNGVKNAKVKDCKNQQTVISATFNEVLTGMVDNGRAQKKVDFSKVQGDHKCKYGSEKVPHDGESGTADDAYIGKECFVLTKDQAIPGIVAFTISDIRGGYRDVYTYGADEDGYDKGCDAGFYLKKKKMAGYNDENGTWVPPLKFYEVLSNQEIPTCPFADFENNDEKDNYYYVIFEDGTVICNCPYCNEID